MCHQHVPVGHLLYCSTPYTASKERHSQPLKSFTEFMKGGKIDKINDNANERAAQKTKGSHGPSGLDSCQWRRLLSSFDKVSNNLRKTVAKIAYRIATEVLPSTSLEAYNNSWLIPLETSLGVRPIVIGEVLRQLTGRCISSCLGAEAKRNGGNIQLWLGQNAEIEHVIHALRKEFEKETSEAILLIEATNAFNVLNITTALEIIRGMCFSLHIPLSNSYETPSRLFVDKSPSYLAKAALQETH